MKTVTECLVMCMFPLTRLYSHWLAAISASNIYSKDMIFKGCIFQQQQSILVQNGGNGEVPMQPAIINVYKVYVSCKVNLFFDFL